MSNEERAQIVVVGAGVVGLTTALLIQETGKYSVTIVAETLPTDPKTIRYTSHWAGADHVSVAGDDQRQQRMDTETFQKMWELSAPGGPAEHCFMRIPQEQYYYNALPTPHELERCMPDFRYLTPSDLPPNCASGVAFTTLTIDTPIYLAWLLARFLGAGGAIVRAAVQHIAQIVDGGACVFDRTVQHKRTPVAVIVCAGLGARFLGGVEDRAMYPIRGQTVLVRTPWVKFGRTMVSPDGRWYIIPRRGGDVILGGTKAPHDWHAAPRPATTAHILRGCLALAPELVPPQGREKGVEALRALVVEEGCGLRPARTGGIRLEVEWAARGVSRDVPTAETDQELQEVVPVVFNYGHGGYGYQSSWGSASIALELLESALQRLRGKDAGGIVVGLSADRAPRVDDAQIATKSW